MMTVLGHPRSLIPRISRHSDVCSNFASILIHLPKNWHGDHFILLNDEKKIYLDDETRWVWLTNVFTSRDLNIRRREFMKDCLFGFQHTVAAYRCSIPLQICYKSLISGVFFYIYRIYSKQTLSKIMIRNHFFKANIKKNKNHLFPHGISKDFISLMILMIF